MGILGNGVSGYIAVYCFDVFSDVVGICLYEVEEVFPVDRGEVELLKLSGDDVWSAATELSGQFPDGMVGIVAYGVVSGNVF